MKERGMIFNAEMVRAILDGRKTQTRRPIKWKQTRFTEIGEREDGSNWPWSEDTEKVCDYWHPCPFGAVGDRIWVRETFGWQIRRDPVGGTGEFRVYRATTPDAVRYQTASGEAAPMKWVPSIHMPRRASRITLEITDVRVERLNNISYDDAISEGIKQEWTCIDPGLGSYAHKNDVQDDCETLWKSIYGEESWAANPWVWVIEFKRIEGGAA
ncbi:hypothetical protein ABP79_18510 [Salmonella enterica subsp. enterica]|nr:hypothetical protein [Salmonella enterica subsp. enterica serovar Schwarzengrund]ECP4654198.1 hypothetical protein [Salmonella enterica subsp. enterica serovar Schwarzengrund]EIP6628066.1 hypothetical protein [Salmonella enterica subsp. enterica serovar Schwarzengrund]